MGVYIEGMEMPKSCDDCPMLEGDRMDGFCHAASKWLDDDEHWTWYVYPEGDMDDSKPCNCPLVEVKAPHGRLIDEDTLIDEGMDIYHMDYFRGTMSGYSKQMIDCTPTVLEAEGKDDG